MKPLRSPDTVEEIFSRHLRNVTAASVVVSLPTSTNSCALLCINIEREWRIANTRIPGDWIRIEDNAVSRAPRAKPGNAVLAPAIDVGRSSSRLLTFVTQRINVVAAALCQKETGVTLTVFKAVERDALG